MSKNVFVIGSINMDLVMSTSRLPLIGESKKGHSFFQNQGGKGANQAIAVKKLGLENVHFIGAVGNDQNGRILKETIESYGIISDGLKVVDSINSGVCIILLDESQNDNVLVIDGGANNYVDEVEACRYLYKHAKPGDILITQLETNLLAVYSALKTAKEIGMYTILNPAPVCDLEKSIYSNLDLIVLNETETKLLTNIDCETIHDARSAYDKFKVNELVITLGEKGGYYVNKEKVIPIPVHKVKAVDTTCAGDTYIGALALKLANGYTIEESLDFAARCSSITVSRKGAGVSIPTKEEVEEIERSMAHEKDN